MYRLFTCKRLTAVNRAQKLSLLKPHASAINAQQFEPQLKWNDVNNVTVRLQSTTTTEPETVVKKKKRARRSFHSKYVELLEVTEAAAHERKSRVKRLNAKKFENFIGTGNMLQPLEYQKVNMDALNQTLLEAGMFDEKPLVFFGKTESSKALNLNASDIDRILKSFYNYREIIDSMDSEHLETTNAENLDSYGTPLEKLHTEDMDLLEDVEPYVIEEVDKKHKNEIIVGKETAKTKARFQSKRHINEEFERLARERALQFNLKSYLQVCASTGALNRGLSTIVMYRQRWNKKQASTKNFVTIELYNILLHGYAEKGSFDRFKNIFALIEEDKLQFSEQTFAAIFECLGRLEPNKDNLKTIQQYIERAEKAGFTLNQIMDRSQFVSDQRDVALDAIQRVRPDFRPIYTPPMLGYVNVLLNHLNEGIRPIPNSENLLTETGHTPKIMYSKRGFSKAQLQEMARQQLQTELDGQISIKSIEKSLEYGNTEECKEKVKELETLWRSQISSAILRDLNVLRNQMRLKPNGHMNYYTYLKSIDTTHFVNILIKEIYKLAEGSETFSPTVNQLYRELGQKVQQRYNIEQKKSNGTLEKMGEVYSSYCAQWESAVDNDNTRQAWQRLVHETRETGPSMDIRSINWPTNVLTSVGRFLYNILMRDIKIDTQILRKKSKTTKQQNLMPAFYTLFRNQGRLVKEEVKPHPVLARLFRASRQQTLTFDSHLVPMLCPPQPWSTPYNGGYLLHKSDLIRLPHQAIQQWERINAANPQSLYPALDSLNQLASIPWRVNTDILDIIIDVFQNGGDAKLDVPQPPSSLPPLPSIHKNDSSVSNQERVKLFKDKLGHRRKQAEMYSLWCDTLYRLSLANHYRDKVFWLPHNMDFRGRVYPIPPHLNHLGSDLARSMLVFHQAQPLGPDGFSWLKLHCINLTGLKKRDSVRERLLYAEDVLSEILDSADNPLTGRKWWTRSDEPWQTLACCIEIAKVHRSENPEEFMSHFPIHQDGSCNGLQHYAALGRDKAGAYSVNLAPSEVPQDVYSTVATKVEKTRKSDAENGLHVAQALEGFVRRKVIKQTVMTTVYGVTRYGARLQIARQLKDIDDFPKDWVWPASTYLTTKTFECLREMFTSTREIQDWFTDCARLIAGVHGQNVEWTTPLGLPVVQPYNRHELKSSGNTRPHGSTVFERMSTDMFERPNLMKQKNAFPPNFIHSLDSSHMMLTSLHCEQAGLTFVSVHDCFWTHACTVPDLNRICREQFVALHAQPILEDLSQFLQKRYGSEEGALPINGSAEDPSSRQSILRKKPQKGDFNLMEVLDSVYFFS